MEITKVMTEGEIIIALVVGCLMALDFISGMIAALANGQWKSKIMRVGLLHKCSLVLCIVLGVVLNVAQRYMDLGITVPVYQSICVYIALMEAGSCIENVCKANPNLVPGKLKSVLGLGRQEDKDE